MPMPTANMEELLRADQIANEVYTSHYSERKTYRFALGCVSVLLFGSMVTNLMLAHRPVVNRYIRIDKIGNAEAIQYSDLNYTPRDAEVRLYLTQWANYRYDQTADAVTGPNSSYRKNFYFLSGPLASEKMNEDRLSGFTTNLRSGALEASTALVRNVTITSLSDTRLKNRTVGTGTAMILVDRTYNTADDARVESWVVPVRYVVDPEIVNTESAIYPQFQDINPLGLTILEFHENRVSVRNLNKQ
jgi:type IV secretion system protein VirB5